MTDASNLTLRIQRLDHEWLVLDAYGLAHAFFRIFPTREGIDAMAGQGEPNRITEDDIRTINRTMGARSSLERWREFLDQEFAWLEAISPDLDLVSSTEEIWQASGGKGLIRTALEATIGKGRGPSVATKVLYLKRPRLFPILDNFVAVMLGVNMPDDRATH